MVLGCGVERCSVVITRFHRILQRFPGFAFPRVCRQFRTLASGSLAAAGSAFQLLAETLGIVERGIDRYTAFLTTRIALLALRGEFLGIMGFRLVSFGGESGMCGFSVRFMTGLCRLASYWNGLNAAHRQRVP